MSACSRIRGAALPFFVVALASFPLLPRLAAQVAGTGTIQGTVTDSTGAEIPNAKVVVTQPATGRTVTVLSSSSGIYVAPALPAGEYTVNVDAAGFRPVLQEHVNVNAIQVVRLDVALNAGSSQEVVVTAAPPDLDTENGSIATTISGDTYTALPLAMNGGPKNPLGFLTLVPGVSNGDLAVPNINGGSPDSSFLYINGLPVTTSEVQGDTRNITGATSTEVVDQFQVITSGVPAYYQGQGITNLVTRSGTNKIHGDVYENLRNTAFDAAGFFQTHGAPTPVEHQNEYGVTAGGPILHDRFFFFGNYDRFKIVQANNPQQYSLPTAAERMGDFSALGVPIYDPATTVCANGICTRMQFPGNIIPMNRLSKVSQSLESYLPATQNDALQNNFANAFNSGNTQSIYLGKLDYTINSKQHAYVLFQYGKNSPIGIPSNGGAQLPLPYASTRTAQVIVWLGQIGHTWELTPNIVNVFGAQFNRYQTPFTNPTNGGNYPTVAGLTGLPGGYSTRDFPPVGFGGPNSPTSWAQTGNTLNVNEIANTFTYQDNVTISKGKHSLTVGGQVILQQENLAIPSHIGNFGFSNNETAGFTTPAATKPGGPLVNNVDPNQGNAYASFLLGSVDNASANDTAIQESGARYKDYAVYAQDDYKATQKLTLNLGVRYTIPKPYTEVLNRNSWFNPTLANPAVDNYHGALQFAGNGPDSCHCATQVVTHYTAIDPRIGAAYAISRDTVVRASYTINHYNGGALGGNAQSGGVGKLGFEANPSFTTPDSGITPAFAWDNGFPAYQHAPFFDPTLNTGYNTTAGNNAGGIGYNRPDTAGRSPYTENWNLTVGQAFTPDLTFQISYAGSESHFVGTNGGVGIYSNQVLPKYQALGGLLTQNLTPEVLAQAQAQFPGITVPYANFVGTLGQALRPFPQYSSLQDQYANFGAASYHALQTTLRMRKKHGLYFLAAYTWSKNMNNSGGVINFLYGVPRTSYNLHQEWSPSTEEVPQQFALNFVYDLPIGKGHAFGSSRAVDLIAGGWSLSGILQYSSGSPLGSIGAACLVPYSGTCYADYGTLANARINGSYGSQEVTNRQTAYLDKNAFTTPAPFTYGNSARTQPLGLHNPNNKNEDLALGKDFHLTERFRFRFQADAFNVFNRTVFGGPNTNIGDSSFGQIGGQSNSARKLQLEGYLRF